MGDAYPSIYDWTQYRRDRATTILAQGPGEALALGLTDAGDVIEQSFADLAQQVADISGARLPVLQRLAQRYGVAVSGLGLSEARLIVAGARVARASRGSVPEVCATWLAATGATAAASRMWVLPRGCMIAQSIVEVPPSAPYMIALRGVLARAVAAGYGLHGLLGVASAARHDETRYDASTYGWSVAITRPGD